MGAAAFVDVLAPYLIEAGYAADEAGVEAMRPRLEAIYPLVSERVKLMTEAVPMIAYLLDEHIELDEKSVEKVLRKEGKGAKTALVEAAAVLNDCEWTVGGIEAALRGLLEKLDAKPKFVFQPIRVAVCGNMVSPPLFESIELLDRAIVEQRLKVAAELAVD